MTLVYRGPAASFRLPDGTAFHLEPGDEIDGPAAEALAEHPQFTAKRAAAKKAAAKRDDSPPTPTTSED